MKSSKRVLVLGVIMGMVLFGCGKAPVQEISDLKASVETAAKEGAAVYAQAELEKLQHDIQALETEVESQKGKLFKTFGNAKETLAQLQQDAEAMKADIPVRKEEAKNAALSAQTDAAAAIDEAKVMLAKAPKGKGTKQDIAAMNSDIEGLTAMMNDVQSLIDQEDYFGARSSAESIKEKAVEISDQITKAIEKVKK